MIEIDVNEVVGQVVLASGYGVHVTARVTKDDQRGVVVINSNPSLIFTPSGAYGLASLLKAAAAEASRFDRQRRRARARRGES